MRLPAGLISFINPFIKDLNEMDRIYENRIEEIRQKFFAAKNYPRKKKKKIRKQLLEEYSFWVGIKKWRKNEFGLIQEIFS